MPESACTRLVACPSAHLTFQQVERDPGESSGDQDGPQCLATLDPEGNVFPEGMIVQLGEIYLLERVDPGVDLREELFRTAAQQLFSSRPGEPWAVCSLLSGCFAHS